MWLKVLETYKCLIDGIEKMPGTRLEDAFSSDALRSIKEEFEWLRKHAQRVSPEATPCCCPEFCTYHARKVFEEQKAKIKARTRQLQILLEQVEGVTKPLREILEKEAVEAEVKEARSDDESRWWGRLTTDEMEMCVDIANMALECGYRKIFAPYTKDSLNKLETKIFDLHQERAAHENGR